MMINNYFLSHSQKLVHVCKDPTLPCLMQIFLIEISLHSHHISRYYFLSADLVSSNLSPTAVKTKAQGTIIMLKKTGGTCALLSFSNLLNNIVLLACIERHAQYSVQCILARASGFCSQAGEFCS